MVVADTLIIVFAKAPVPGQVKTRLIPALGAVGAAMLHTTLVERAIETAVATKHDMTLYCTPDAGHAFFVSCVEDFDVALEVQVPDADLGARMLTALESGLREYSQVVLIGSDCPALTRKHLLSAEAALAATDVALIPAEDGGYVLIAARKTHPMMFANIRWGEATVLVSQQAALQACGLGVSLLDTLWDVDRPEDLRRLANLKPPLAFSLPDLPP
jgi:rSAM/selenodomain-associated transferase 1